MKTSAGLLGAAFIGWGDRTIDEMNIGGRDFYYITDQEYADLQKDKAGARRTTAAQDRQ